ncbi:mitochondrial AAA+ superfamily ATPase [Andalucia godoyi]|uniref:Mitochondrial AAA+ superfamily ATPase n=1 Tax=Andalucia godoyi TaxID=505711 RepID=A0A8K0F0Q7_ANDGO|nr:mitochondrial AAA+ superfamily ATPase [Andalucia godoyi]|eukprot:ANDGO_00567.mRNA.1 mitochondrial AAA+ superfamily ATPase
MRIRIEDVIAFVVAPVVTFFSMRYLISKLDPQSHERRAAKQRRQELIRKIIQSRQLRLVSIIGPALEEIRARQLQIAHFPTAQPTSRHSSLSISDISQILSRHVSDDAHGETELDELVEFFNSQYASMILPLEKVELDDYEELIASELVCPDEINVSFNDIGGLEVAKRGLFEAVVFPLSRPDLYRGSLLSQPKGILLYGPPGTGKTMLAQALAKESSANFVNLRLSTLQNKWYGESQKLVRATFSLARKLQPCIIFIDEMDAFLKDRSSGTDHEATSAMKAEFMSLWDGFQAGDECRVVVMGATNRPQDIDEAILRRMPRQFHVALPDQSQRREILLRLLRSASCDSSEAFNIDEICGFTEGYSGSDLKELCRQAALVPVREYVVREESSDMIRSKPWRAHATASQGNGNRSAVRPLRTTDFREASLSIHPTIHAQRDMHGKMQDELNRNNPSYNPTVSSSQSVQIDPQSMIRFLATLLSSQYQQQ